MMGGKRKKIGGKKRGMTPVAEHGGRRTSATQPHKKGGTNVF